MASTKNTYSEKLKDPRWQKKRLEIMGRDEFSCQLCGDGESMLSVHHRYYIWGRDPWDYSGEMLVALCEPCHEVEHEEKERADDLVKVMRCAGFSNQDISELSSCFNVNPLGHIPAVFVAALCRVLADAKRRERFFENYFNEICAENEQKNG